MGNAARLCSGRGLSQRFGFRCSGGRYQGFWAQTPPFRKSKTSDFFDRKCRCFVSKVRHFDAKKSDVFNFPYPEESRFDISSKKCFVIFSYIPTPRYRKSLYALVISGVGQGAGCRSGVGDILHFLCFSSPFPPSFLHESVPKGTFPCQMQQETASFLSVSFGRLSGDATGGFKVSSIKVLLRFYINPQPHTWQA